MYLIVEWFHFRAHQDNHIPTRKKYNITYHSLGKKQGKLHTNIHNKLNRCLEFTYVVMSHVQCITLSNVLCVSLDLILFLSFFFLSCEKSARN